LLRGGEGEEGEFYIFPPGLFISLGNLLKAEGGRGGLFLFFYQHLHIKGGGGSLGELVVGIVVAGRTHTCTCIYIYTYIHVNTCIYIYIYIYMPVHLYLHILATHLRIATQILNTQQQRPQ
jgi:hypothetical protein